MKNWIVQSSGLRKDEATIERLLKSLDRVEAKWTDFGVIPFSTEITNWENMDSNEWKTTFSHVSTKALRIFTDNTLKPTDIFVGCDPVRAAALLKTIRAGIFYDVDAFDMAVYLRGHRDILLNGDAQVMRLGDMLRYKFSYDKFVKPGKDLKLFDGLILPAMMTLREKLDTMTTDGRIDQSLDELMIHADLKTILGEWRFFVRKGHLITGSQYRIHGKLRSSSYIPEYIVEGAKKLAWQYQPADWYVMDVAMTEALELKVIEYNCVNCSGFYDSDIGMIAQAL